jgi:hypothetical protein
MNYDCKKRKITIKNSNPLGILLVLTAFAVMPLGGCGIYKNSDNNTKIAENSTDFSQTETIIQTTETITETETETESIEEYSVETNPSCDNPTAEIVNGCILANKGTDAQRAMEQYYYNKSASESFAQILDKYSKDLENVDVYGMIIPTSQAFYTPDSIADNYTNQGEAMADTYSQMSLAKGVEIYDILNEHKSEYLYSKTDYHWQPLAAYYASEIFCSEAGVDFLSLSGYDSVTRYGYLGAFYSVNNITALENFPDIFTYYKPKNLDKYSFTYYNTNYTGATEGNLFFDDNSISNSYTVFVGRDDTILHAHSDNDNGRVLVIFKDSYGNALVPFLTASFSDIYLCDFRYFDLSAESFIQQVGGTDLLFAIGAPSANSTSKVEKLENIR